MKAIERRLTELEKEHKGGLMVRFLTLYGGETAPEIKDEEIKDADVFITMIMQMDGPRPAGS
jgi:hypothetical protein